MSQLKHSRIPSTKGHIWFKIIGCCYLQNAHTRTNSLWVTAVFWSCISNSAWFQSLLSSPPLTPPKKTCCATTDKRNSLYYLWVKWIQHHCLNRCQFTCDCTNKAEKQRSIDTWIGSRGLPTQPLGIARLSGIRPPFDERRFQLTVRGQRLHNFQHEDQPNNFKYN